MVLDQQIFKGLDDIDNENEFVWSDGSPAGHIKFAPGQPNNFGNQDYVTIWKEIYRSNGDLNDDNCISKNKFLCRFTE